MILPHDEDTHAGAFRHGLEHVRRLHDMRFSGLRTRYDLAFGNRNAGFDEHQLGVLLVHGES